MDIHLSLFMIACFGVHRSSSDSSRRQKRNWIIDSFTIDEGYKGQFPYLLGKIKIEKGLTLLKIHGQGVDVEPKGVLQINQNTGEITVHHPVDYERYKVLKLIFQAYREESVIDMQLGIEILITDSNDNPPKFDLETYVISIKESTLQGTDVIVVKASDADATENNRRFDLKIVSVTPKQQDMEFYLKHTSATQTGIISFKGCLDREKAEKYMILVEAKDQGEEIQLSSSCTIIINIEDGNNHLPEITGETGPGGVKEGEEHILVYRLQVTDEDARGTAAWRAKYQIQEDADNNFIITTDPDTNEGLLYMEKTLDYEESHQKIVTVTVENEIPYHTCKVVNRKATGLWGIVTTGGTGIERSHMSARRVTVTVEDVNEPPIFDEPKKQVTLTENTEARRYLVTFTAKDPDFGSSNTVVYIKGDDPANWITVDRVTGKITTSKALDRESHFVKDNIYKATIYAVDNGKPPMTGTATLSIKINDENDNAPSLNVSTIVMCQSDGPSLAKITVFDLDEEPYGGPFHFKLLGDAEDKWRVDPHQGYSANLVKENTVHSGQFELILEVSDLQHKAASHNLSVTVCNCLKAAKPSCHSPKISKVGGGAVGIILFSVLLLGGISLLATLLSCKAENKALPDEGSGQYLMNCNIETRGSDCEVGIAPSTQRYSQNVKHKQLISDVSTAMLKQSMGSSSAKRRRYLDGNSEYRRWMGGTDHSAEHIREIMLKELNTMLYELQAPREELGDYAPHVYAEEGYIESSYELDAISIPDTSSEPDLDLNFKFSTLASIVMPSESTAFSTKTSSVM